MVRCAGKNASGVINSKSSMKALMELHRAGSPLGVHIHCRTDDHGGKIFTDYTDPQRMKVLIEEAVNRFQDAFSYSPELFGMGDLACSNEEVAVLLSEFGFKLNISDLFSNKYSIRQNITAEESLSLLGSNQGRAVQESLF